MKLLRLLAPALALSLCSLLSAAEPTKATDYTVTVSGVVCSACKAHVTAAFKKLPGVQNVNFARGEKEGTQSVTFNSSSPSLTKEDAIKALGEDAKSYEVLSLARK